MKTVFKQKLLKISHYFFKNQLQKSQNLMLEIPLAGLDPNDLWALGRFHQIFFLGQLLGLPTLHSILAMHGIQSNSLQIKYKNLCKSLTNNKLKIIYEYIFKCNFLEKLEHLATLGASEWSKANVTAIIDASIFKQFLMSMLGEDVDAETLGSYGTFYSGQHHSTVSGFKVVTFGVTIQEVFYPLFLEFVKKGSTKESESAIAATLLERFDKMWQELRLKYSNLPKKVPLSCDNGYSNASLLKACDKHHFILISVPKTNNNFTIGSKTQALSQWIETNYLGQERLFLIKNQKNHSSKNDTKPFLLRIKAYYEALKIEVTLLFFRLNGSKKGTVIYCPHEQSPAIFSKTMRHHWFARTQIEPFFKLLKHVLRIQEAKSQTKFEMTCKLYRFFVMAIEAQRFRDFIRKNVLELEKCGFKQIVRYITFHLNKIEPLEELLKTSFLIPKDRTN